MRKTKKQVARDLFETAATGPSFSFTFAHVKGLTEAQREAVEAYAKEQYQIWVGSWVLPELRTLLPDLNKLPLRPKELSI